MIKKILLHIHYELEDKKLLLTTLTKAYRLKNDRVLTRLPIKWGMLEMLLFKIEWTFEQQPYLEIVYKAIFLLSYYGLLRIREVTYSPHVIKVKDVNIAALFLKDACQRVASAKSKNNRNFKSTGECLPLPLLLLPIRYYKNFPANKRRLQIR